MPGPAWGTGLRAGAQRLAARGGTLDVMLEGVAGLLGEVLTHDGAMVATLDPATTLPTRVWPAAAFHAASDPLGYDDLVTAPVPVTADPGPPARLRAVLRGRGAVWGALDLVRGGPGRAFTPEEIEAVADAGTALADLLRLTMLRTALATPRSVAHAPGLVVVDATGRAELAAQGDGWLEMVAEREAIPSAMRAVTAAARAGDGLSRTALRSLDGGWVVLHASPMGDDDAVAIIVEGSQPLVLAPAVVDEYGLTVAALADADEAALSSALERAGVAHRDELLSAIHHRFYQPRMAAGAEPSPYGWYLDTAPG